MTDKNIKEMHKKTQGGWKGKTMVFYTLKPEALVMSAEKIFGSEEMKPSDLVKKAWDFVKANSTVEKKKL
jgi:hypothetical protein